MYRRPDGYWSLPGVGSRPEAVREPSGSRPETVGPVADAEAQQEELPAAPVPAGAGDAREGEGGGDCGVDAFQEYCRSIELPLDTLTARNFRRRFGPRSEFSDHQRYCADCAKRGTAADKYPRSMASGHLAFKKGEGRLTWRVAISSTCQCLV